MIFEFIAYFNVDSHLTYVFSGKSVVIFIIDGSTPTDVFEKAKESVIRTIRELKPDEKMIVYIIIYNDNKITKIKVKSPKEVEPAVIKVNEIKHVKSKPNTLLIFQLIKKIHPGQNAQVVPLGGMKIPEDPKLKNELLSLIKYFLTVDIYFTFVTVDPKDQPDEWTKLIPEIAFVPATKIIYLADVITSKLVL